jgi:hypothetical protein
MSSRVVWKRDVLAFIAEYGEAEILLDEAD